MNKKFLLILTFFLTFHTMRAAVGKADMPHSKKIVSQWGALITACVALPLSVLFFHKGIKTFNERKAITESIPGLEDRIKKLQKICAEYKDPIDDDMCLRIHWTNLYDSYVREYDPVLADKLLELRAREARSMIPGFLLAIVGICTGVAAVSF